MPLHLSTSQCTCLSPSVNFCCRWHETDLQVVFIKKISPMVNLLTVKFIARGKDVD